MFNLHRTKEVQSYFGLLFRWSTFEQRPTHQQSQRSKVSIRVGNFGVPKAHIMLRVPFGASLSHHQSITKSEGAPASRFDSARFTSAIFSTVTFSSTTSRQPRRIGSSFIVSDSRTMLQAIVANLECDFEKSKNLRNPSCTIVVRSSAWPGYNSCAMKVRCD